MKKIIIKDTIDIGILSEIERINSSGQPAYLEDIPNQTTSWPLVNIGKPDSKEYRSRIERLAKEGYLCTHKKDKDSWFITNEGLDLINYDGLHCKYCEKVCKVRRQEAD